MVSTGQITGMAVSILLPLLVAALFYFLIGRKSRKIETGMLGAAAYGCLGFLWQQLIYLVAAVGMTSFSPLRNAIEGNYVLSALLFSFVCSVFVALGMYWGVYLTNQKQKSLYRSVTVGIGFGVGNAVWNIILPYAMSFYYSIQINAGTFAKDAETRESILATSPATMYLDALKCILFLLVYMGVAYEMSRYYLEGKKWYAWGIPIVVQLFISMTNSLIKQYWSETASKIGIYTVLFVIAAISVWQIRCWLTGEDKRG